MTSLNPNRRLLTTGLVTVVAALSGTTVATAAQSSDAIDNADLVALSGGGLLHYEVDGAVQSQTVTIAGRKAQKVIRLADEGAGAYHALMGGKKLKTGGTYTVTVRVKLRNGKTATLRERLVVHRRHATRS
jgi:hypothetical protein